MMVAVNECTPQGCGSAVQYLLTDHLGSTVAVTNQSGTLTSQQRYLPLGEERAIPNSPILATDFGYTGQRMLDSGMGGIMDYKARFYSPYLNRFLQPDTIIPDQSNPQSWNRFSYVYNNPILFTDPTGHKVCWEGSKPGQCLDVAGYLKNDLETRYDIKIKGPWDKDKLLYLTESLNLLSQHAGGDENLRDVFHDGAEKWGFDDLTFTYVPGGAKPAAWCQNNDDSGCVPGSVVFSDAVFSSAYQFDLKRFRPSELGLHRNLDAGIKVSMIHEMVHVFADARPVASKVYSWRVPISGTDAEERMANTIAFYVVSGMQDWPSKPNHFNFVRDINALWLATP